MIPLNKPLIYPRSLISANEKSKIFYKLFPGQNLSFTFSARQALNIIYKKLFQEFGQLKIAVSPLTCFEALFPIINNGHLISFIDIDAETFNLNESLLSADTDAIQAIHLGGNPQNMDMICSAVQKNSQILIEDCAQAMLSLYNNKQVGTFGDYAVFSLPKNIYSIAGGILLSKSSYDQETLKKMGIPATYYRILKRTLESKMNANKTIYDIVHSLLLSLKGESSKSLNSKLSINNMVYNTILDQSANISKMQELRRNNANYIINGTDNNRIVPQKILTNSVHNNNRLYFRSLKKDTKLIASDLRKAGIGANHLTQDSGSYYQEDVFTDKRFIKYAEKKKIENYSRLHNKIFCIPVSPALSMKELNYIILHLNKV